jgi:superfamily I DNA/RNA helicase
MINSNLNLSSPPPPSPFSIVIYCDILRVKDIDERNKLLYTSITRAKKNLYLVY